MKHLLLCCVLTLVALAMTCQGQVLHCVLVMLLIVRLSKIWSRASACKGPVACQGSKHVADGAAGCLVPIEEFAENLHVYMHNVRC